LLPNLSRLRLTFLLHPLLRLPQTPPLCQRPQALLEASSQCRFNNCSVCSLSFYFIRFFLIRSDPSDTHIRRAQKG
jgi:hypothetical protein